MAEHNKEEGADISSVGISVGLSILICVSILGYVFTNQKPLNESAFDFNPIEIDASRLSTERNARVGTKKFDMEDPRAKGLLSVMRMANAEQFSTLLTDDEKLKRQTELVHHANQALEQGWFPAFWSIGEILFRECRSELSKVVTQIQKGADPKTFRNAKEYINYREACGDMLPMLFKYNIISERGQWVDTYGPDIADLSLRYSWGFILADRRHPSQQLTPYEYELYEQWRVTNKEGFSREERLKFLGRAKNRIKDFPANLLMAKIQFQDGKSESALKLLTDAEKMNPTDPEIRRLKRYLEKTIKTKAQ